MPLRHRSSSIHKLGVGVNLDLRKVRYFVEVAERLHFGQAAKSLHIAQPALSRQIRALEQELGVELLVRNSRSVALTPAGERLLAGGREVLDAATALSRRVVATGRTRPRLTVGFTCGTPVTAVVRRFLDEVPDVDVSVVHIERDQQAKVLYDGTADVVFVRKPLVEDDLTVVDLFTEPRVALVPADHRLAGRRAVTRNDLAGETVLHHAGTRDLAHATVPVRARGRITVLPADTSPFPVQVRDVRAMEEKLELVAVGAGITLLPESAAKFYARPDVVRLPVVDLARETVCLAYCSDTTSPFTAAFTRSAHEVVAESRGDLGSRRTG
ncbi:LysR family transcriptional regulator [Actinosynnema sp. NPDC053489]|uniref:LysR family transcriptional regulator n=1 Tax=Actinosynnema sp. NPDC053489 TaxID=3363916 RepID=UPI0037C51CD0